MPCVPPAPSPWIAQSYSPCPAAHPLGYSETESHIPGGAKLLELEFKCGKYFLKEATYQKVNTAELFPVKLLPGTFMLREIFTG